MALPWLCHRDGHHSMYVSRAFPANSPPSQSATSKSCTKLSSEGPATFTKDGGKSTTLGMPPTYAFCIPYFQNWQTSAADSTLESNQSSRLFR
ncbi:hypothetical protein JB92DRAFT_914262 [Gautieria morchelliformis]|nr:hypothetical protein JB92DRAFT_914262 [Gautieria morchelliformis]